MVMVNQEHLYILTEAIEKQDVSVWNRWRYENQDIRPHLSGAIFKDVLLREANFENALLSDISFIGKTDLKGSIFNNIIANNLSLAFCDLSNTSFIDSSIDGCEFGKSKLHHSDFSNSIIHNANFYKADLSDVNFNETSLSEAVFTSATLHRCQFRNASLFDANLVNATIRNCDFSNASPIFANLLGIDVNNTNFSGANFSGSSLVEAKIVNSNMTNATVYGTSTWKIELTNTLQTNLLITRPEEPQITVDNIEVAQLIYLMLNNNKIRDVIDTITGKAVLILGRFTNERKMILDRLREELRERNYLPILFDFEKPISRDFTETVLTLAHLSRFVIADLTNPRSLPHELMSFIPNLPSVPVQTIILKDQDPYAMFGDFRRGRSWVLPVVEYESEDELISQLNTNIIEPAEEKAIEMSKH